MVLQSKHLFIASPGNTQPSQYGPEIEHRFSGNLWIQYLKINSNWKIASFTEYAAAGFGGIIRHKKCVHASDHARWQHQINTKSVSSHSTMRFEDMKTIKSKTNCIFLACGRKPDEDEVRSSNQAISLLIDSVAIKLCSCVHLWGVFEWQERTCKPHEKLSCCGDR